jgi:hypothetical protein
LDETAERLAQTATSAFTVAFEEYRVANQFNTSQQGVQSAPAPDPRKRKRDKGKGKQMMNDADDEDDGEDFDFDNLGGSDDGELFDYSHRYKPYSKAKRKGQKAGPSQFDNTCHVSNERFQTAPNQSSPCTEITSSIS